MQISDRRDSDAAVGAGYGDPLRLLRHYKLWPSQLPVVVLVWIALGVVLLPVLLLGAFGFSYWVERERRETIERVLQHASNLGHTLDRELAGYTDLAEVLANSRYLQLGDMQLVYEVARDAATKAGGYFELINEQGGPLVNSRLSRGAALPVPEAVDAIRRVLASGQSAVGDLGKEPSASELLFAVRVPVKIRGERRYVLSYVPREGVIYDLIRQTTLPEGWLAAVIDGNGRLVARTERNNEFYGRTASAEFILRLVGRSGMIESRDLEGRESVTAFHASNRSAWKVVVWAPKALLQDPGRRAQSMVLWLIGLALLASITAAWLVSRAITGPAQRLAASARALGSGAPVEFAPGVMIEANIAGRALAEAAEEIASREARLRDSEARFRNMADHAPVMIWVADQDGSPQFRSASWYEFTGQPAGHGLGKNWLDAVHSEERLRVQLALREAVQGQKAQRFEYRLRRADGTWRWVLDTVQPRFGRSGRFLGLIGSVIDLTERKEREQQVDLLLRELNHRSKNMLGLVLAVARQTLASEPDDFLIRFTDRIQALSASQDILVRNDWQGAGMLELVKSQLAHFADLVGDRILIDGPDLMLSPSAAQSIGMAMHELATNAGKYGALSNDVGRVEIRWRLDHVETPRLTMCWTEVGGPPVNPPARKGFGTVVVDSMVRMGLQGKVQLDFSPGGIVWTLTCPASSALESTPGANEQRQAGALT